MSVKTTIQYGVWQEPSATDTGYWSMYESIEDAVSAEGDGTEVYKFDGVRLGKFKRSYSLQKIKKKKAKRKASK